MKNNDNEEILSRVSLKYIKAAKKLQRAVLLMVKHIAEL